MDGAERERRLRRFERNCCPGTGCQPVVGGADPSHACVRIWSPCLCSAWRPTPFERALLFVRRQRRRLVRFLFVP